MPSLPPQSPPAPSCSAACSARPTHMPAPNAPSAQGTRFATSPPPARDTCTLAFAFTAHTHTYGVTAGHCVAQRRRLRRRRHQWLPRQRRIVRLRPHPPRKRLRAHPLWSSPRRRNHARDSRRCHHRPGRRPTDLPYRCVLRDKLRPARRTVRRRPVPHHRTHRRPRRLRRTRSGLATASTTSRSSASGWAPTSITTGPHTGASTRSTTPSPSSVRPPQRANRPTPSRRKEHSR